MHPVYPEKQCGRAGKMEAEQECKTVRTPKIIFLPGCRKRLQFLNGNKLYF
jgi:hypothetical protein